MKGIMAFLIILVAAFLIYLLFKNKEPMKPFGRGSRAPARAPLAAPMEAPAGHWEDGGRFETEVMCESAYQPAIRALAGEHGEQKADRRHQAILMPDDDNLFDGKAVAVLIEGELIGYLAQNDALRLRRLLARRELAGKPTSCAAAIRGGSLWQGKRLQYAVWLDLPPFD